MHTVRDGSISTANVCCCNVFKVIFIFAVPLVHAHGHRHGSIQPLDERMRQLSRDELAVRLSGGATRESVEENGVTRDRQQQDSEWLTLVQQEGAFAADRTHITIHKSSLIPSPSRDPNLLSFPSSLTVHIRAIDNGSYA